MIIVVGPLFMRRSIEENQCHDVSVPKSIDENHEARRIFQRNVFIPFILAYAKEILILFQSILNSYLRVIPSEICPMMNPMVVKQAVARVANIKNRNLQINPS